MKFAHLGDCHLGGWRQPELKELNFKSFQFALEKCKKEKVEFILIAGDLFDSAYPPIETLKETFEEFRKLKEANIPVFLIAGSHDYSVSGKTFLDVLEKSGFCKNVTTFEERNGMLLLEPTIYKNVAIYGYPGKKSGLEVDDIARIKLQESPLFKILMLHTSIRGAIGNLPIKAVDETALPKVDYTALAHLHVHYIKDNFVYSGPTFPNSLSEIEDLKRGSFCIYENGKITRESINLIEVESFKIKITNASDATEKIISIIGEKEVKNKLIILRLFGVLERGKVSDINFEKISSYLAERKAHVFLKSTSKLVVPESDSETSIHSSETLEIEIINNFLSRNHSKFNSLVLNMMKALQIEKNEDETSMTFEDRLLSETDRIINNEIQETKN